MRSTKPISSVAEVPERKSWTHYWKAWLASVVGGTVFFTLDLFDLVHSILPQLASTDWGQSYILRPTVEISIYPAAVLGALLVGSTVWMFRAQRRTEDSLRVIVATLDAQPQIKPTSPPSWEDLLADGHHLSNLVSSISDEEWISSFNRFRDDAVRMFEPDTPRGGTIRRLVNESRSADEKDGESKTAHRRRALNHLLAELAKLQPRE